MPGFDYEQRDYLITACYELMLLGAAQTHKRIKAAKILADTVTLCGFPLSEEHLRNIACENRKKPDSFGFMIRNVKT